MPNITEDTLRLVKTAQATPNESLMKSFMESTSAISGLTAYDLEAPAKLLYPVLTPLRNMIPRVGSGQGIQANWRAITGINVTNLSAGVSEGNRGGVTTHTTQDFLAAYRGLGLEDYATFEATYAAEGFDDARARTVEGNLRGLMIQEESVILGGNTSMALGTTPTPTLTAGSSGSLVGTFTLSVICVALSYDGWWQAGGFNNGYVGTAQSIASLTLEQTLTRVNADGSSDTYNAGLAQKSTNATISITSSTGNCLASIAAVQGAMGYPWFWGTVGNETLGAITNINSINIKATATGTQLASTLTASDNSRNALVFDGLLSQVAKSGSGGYYTALATGTAGTGSTLTSDGAGGIIEIDAAFGTFFDQYRLSPQVIFVNRQQQKDITNKVIGGGGAPLYRFTIDATNPGQINAGSVVGSYLNKVTGDMVEIQVHPNMPVGTMLFYSRELPYKLTNVDTVLRMLTRQDYYQIEWPRRSRKYEYGIYVDEVLQNYFPPAFGMITNIAAG